MLLKQGDTGTNVKNCQYTLHILTYNVNGIDGSYGPGMVSAVQQYQANNGLTVNGTIDNATWNALTTDIAPIAQALHDKGFYYGSIYLGGDEVLYHALRGFQSANGLTVDGMCGPATRTKLYSNGPNNTIVDWDNATLTQGATGDAVICLQYALHILGCVPGAIDGSLDLPLPLQ